MEKRGLLIKFNIIAIVCIIIFSITLTQKQLQNDTFYTIKVGEHIVNTKQIDMKDLFSWHEDLTYTYPHWLYDVGIYLIYNTGYNINGETGGMTAIYISTCVFATILGLLIYSTNVKINKNHVISFLLTLITLFLLKGHIAARAQLVSSILFVLEIYCIEQFLNTKKIRYGIELFVIAVLIANIHAAVWYMFFIILLPYFAEYVIVLLLDKFHVNKERACKIKFEKRDNIKWLLIIVIICMLAGLLTPQNTFEPYTHIIKLMKGNTTDYIGEHKPIILIEAKDILVLLGVIISFLIFTKAKISLKDLFMLGGLILMTLISGRQKSMLVLIGIYSINRIVDGYINMLLGETDLKLMDIFSRIYSIIALFCIVISFGLIFYSDKNKKDYIDKEKYPVKMAEYVLKNLDINNIRIYNDYNYGSYLIYKNIPVFIDSRCDLYTPEFNKKDIFMDCQKISNLSTDYEEKFNEYRITHLIIKTSSKLKMILDKDIKYRTIYYDENFCIIERK